MIEYLKCPWCGGAHNRYENKCRNCGGVLGHKSDLHKSIQKNHGGSVDELTRQIKKIKRVLVLIFLIVASTSAYFMYGKIIENHDKNDDFLIHLQDKKKVFPVKARVTPVNNQLPRTEIQVPKLQEQEACMLGIDKGTKPNVYLVTSYKGLNTSKFQFGASGHEVKESEVIVNKPGESVVLVLMAYDPVIWKVKKTFSTTVLGVVLAGYHEQIVSGLPKVTPVLEAIYEKKTACRYFYDSIEPGGQKYYIAQRIEKITGSQPVEYITAAYEGKFFVGDKNLTSPFMQYSNDDPDAVLKQELEEKGEKIDDVLPAEEGINQLIRQGKIRPASTTDIDDWSKISSQHRDGGRHLMHPGFTYVILTQIQFPRGMYGAHSKSFILKEDAPLPTGQIAHNTVYLMKDGVCMGTACAAF